MRQGDLQGGVAVVEALEGRADECEGARRCLGVCPAGSSLIAVFKVCNLICAATRSCVERKEMQNTKDAKMIWLHMAWQWCTDSTDTIGTSERRSVTPEAPTHFA